MTAATASDDEERKGVGEMTMAPEADRVRTGPRYGILGGTFDPPHLGHLVLGQEALVRLALDMVWFVPAGVPPHKPRRRITARDDRRAMVDLAIDGNARFALSDVELKREGPSYTADTVSLLRQQWGESVTMVFIMGWDMLTYLPQWRQPERVIATLDGIAATHRPGFTADPQDVARLTQLLPGLRDKLTIVPVPEVEVSSSAIRQRVASGVPIRYLVSDSVRSFIEERGLYREVEEAESEGEQP